MSLGNSNIHQQGDIPEIVKLPNNRIRVIRRFQKFTREDVDNANLGSLMGNFGAQDATGEQISGQGYTDCRLVSVEVDNRFEKQTNADNPVLVKTYETLTSSFVEITDPTISIEENGLRKITKFYRAISGTTSSNTVGTTTLPTTGEILANSEIQDNTAFAELTEIYVESGILSETLDNVGSQKAKVIETIGADPATPSGYSLASKQESNFEGLQTNRFTFLKDNVILSESEDRVGSQSAIVQEVFNGTPATPSGYSIANEQESDVDGIPTKRFTFLKNNVVLSVSEDRVGSQLAVTNEVFKPTSDAFAGVDVANVALSGYEEADRRKSDFAGIPTIQYRFLKADVQLSESEDKVGSQNSITEEWFKPAASRDAKADYSLARKEESDIGGIPTERYTFLKPSILSLRQELSGGSKRVSVQAFDLDVADVISALSEVTTDHILLSKSESNYARIKTTTFEFQLDESFTEDYELNGLQRISLVELGVSDFTAQVIGSISSSAPTTGLYLGTQKIDNGGAIKTRESVWLESGQISKLEVQGPDGLPDTKTVTYVSQITEPTSSGILLSKNIDNTGGHKIYTYKYLEGQTAGSTPIGVLQSHEQIIEVRKAGSVTATGGSTSSLPYIISIPPRIGKVKATVSIELTASNTVSVPVAYNLSDVSCSATTVNTRSTPIGVEQGGSLTVAVYNRRQTTSHQPFSNYYATNTGDSGSITTPASIIRDNDNIIGETLNEVASSVITLTGPNTVPTTTGIYDENLEPVFIDALGTQYYRKTTYTIA